jgi:toxin ParE1/3/4
MKLALFLLPKAVADIDEHVAYIAKDNIEKALEFDEAAFESFDRLREMPFIGSERAYMNEKLQGLRMWFVKGFENYLIFYRPSDTRIEIVRVLHSARDRDFIINEE